MRQVGFDLSEPFLEARELLAQLEDFRAHGGFGEPPIHHFDALLEPAAAERA